MFDRHTLSPLLGARNTGTCWGTPLVHKVEGQCLQVAQGSNCKSRSPSIVPCGCVQVVGEAELEVTMEASNRVCDITIEPIMEPQLCMPGQTLEIQVSVATENREALCFEAAREGLTLYLVPPDGGRRDAIICTPVCTSEGCFSSPTVIPCLEVYFCGGRS
jgi:hypothetical protein